MTRMSDLLRLAQLRGVTRIDFRTSIPVDTKIHPGKPREAGWAVSLESPKLPGPCVRYGDRGETALENAIGAMDEWLAAQVKEAGSEVESPTSPATPAAIGPRVIL